jgi:hypothetical protein
MSTENPVPGTKEYEALVEQRRAAADAWIRENVNIAIVVPRAVAKDLFPNGYGLAEFGPLASSLIPGETAESVEVSPNYTFVLLKRG